MAEALPDQSESQDGRRWKVTVCPGCQRGQLHRGVLRGHCEFCSVYFSVEDERPDRLTAREARRYPMHGSTVLVVPASERDRLAGEVERLREEMTIYFMALEQIRDRTHQKRTDDSAPAAAHNFARRALEQGFALRSGANDENGETK